MSVCVSGGGATGEENYYINYKDIMHSIVGCEGVHFKHSREHSDKKISRVKVEDFLYILRGFYSFQTLVGYILVFTYY